MLEQQRGAAEFEVAKKSIFSFNDALESVAWKLQASRSTRFTIEYGELTLTPSNTPSNSINITATIANPSQNYALYNSTTGVVTYFLSDKYTSFGEGYSGYILGNSSNILVGSAESYGRAVIQQPASWVSITLDYRVRAMRTAVINVTIGGVQTPVNYVDIWVIKLKMLVTQPWSYIHDFDLKAKCTSIKTVTYGPYTVSGAQNVDITVKIGSSSSVGSIALVSGKVVFNVVVSEVQVYV